MKFRRPYAAFTLIELLVVIAIIGILAAIVGPSLTHFGKGDAIISSTRQMLDAVARARQLAISQRTTVYMVFVPTNFWNDPAAASWTSADKMAATNILDKQLVGYNYISLRTVGDQPGQGVPRYLSSWQTLPEGTFIPLEKFSIPRNSYYTVSTNIPPTANGYRVYGFETTYSLPFPLAETKAFTVVRPYVSLPYIAFDYLGRAIPSIQEGADGEFIPLAHGSVLYAKNPATKALQFNSPSVQETPLNNSITSYNLIHIDWLTGRARLEHQEVQ